MRLILASTSPYRRELLARLRLPFDCVRPETRGKLVDESPLPGESPTALVRRLARAKAMAVTAIDGDAWVVGSDQAAELDGTALGKPGNREAAIAQLMAMSGRTVVFRTAVAAMRGIEDGFDALDTTLVRFRKLQLPAIKRYVDAEQPFDCAGSFKSEGSGIALFESIESQDPTALIGLPLIATARLLREAGFSLP